MEACEDLEASKSVGKFGEDDRVGDREVAVLLPGALVDQMNVMAEKAGAMQPQAEASDSEEPAENDEAPAEVVVTAEPREVGESRGREVLEAPAAES